MLYFWPNCELLCCFFSLCWQIFIYFIHHLHTTRILISIKNTGLNGSFVYWNPSFMKWSTINYQVTSSVSLSVSLSWFVTRVSKITCWFSKLKPGNNKQNLKPNHAPMFTKLRTWIELFSQLLTDIKRNFSFINGRMST